MTVWFIHPVRIYYWITLRGLILKLKNSGENHQVERISQATITEETFLLILQLGDTFFPSGGFSHSYGLETYVQEGLIKTGNDLKDFLNVVLKQIFKPTDFLALSLIHSYASFQDIDSIIRIDQILAATKTTYENRMASMKMGKTLLNIAVEIWKDRLIEEFAYNLKNAKAIGNHASVYGLLTYVMRIPQRYSLLLFMNNTVVNLLSAGLRLLPLGQREAQRILNSLHPLLIEIADEIKDLTEEDIGTFTPAYEIRCMSHERLYSRLFMS